MPKLGAMELGIILLIILMIFGVGKLPQVGSSLGKAIRGFKQGASGDAQEEPKEQEEAATPTVTKSKAKKRVAKKSAEAKAEV